MTPCYRYLASKFTYRHVNKDAPYSSIKQALSLLTQAKICHRVQATQGNGVPLGAETIDKQFKMIMLDVGLASTLSGLSQQSLHNMLDLTLINQGGISEQYVGQLLRTLRRKKYQLALRINADKPSVTDVATKTATGQPANYRLISLPFYLLQQLPRLLSLK